jgi:hypothetical protein
MDRGSWKLIDYLVVKKALIPFNRQLAVIRTLSEKQVQA